MKKIEYCKILIKLDCWHLIPYKVNHTLQEKDYLMSGFLCFELVITYKKKMKHKAVVITCGFVC